jgi:hypothetical protein
MFLGLNKNRIFSSLILLFLFVEHVEKDIESEQSTLKELFQPMLVLVHDGTFQPSGPEPFRRSRHGWAQRRTTTSRLQTSRCRGRPPQQFAIFAPQRSQQIKLCSSIHLS